MAVPLEAKEIVVGDYSADHGHVKQVRRYDSYVELTFINGDVITPANEMELMIDQGGRF